MQDLALLPCSGGILAEEGDLRMRWPINKETLNFTEFENILGSKKGFYSVVRVYGF